MSRPTRFPTSPLLAALVVALVACQSEGGTSGSVDDSTYVRVMGSLRRLHDERLSNPILPLPQPIGPQGRQPTPEQVARRDTLQKARYDSVARVDSAARAALLARERVTPDALMATARALSKDPQRSQKVNDAVSRRAIALDSAARAAKAKSTDSLRADSVRRAAGARDSADRTKRKP
jgi:streptogramin lyase